MRVAAIDIGTVTTRLLVADVARGVVTELIRRQAITHLGEGWTATGHLSVEAISRVASTVEGFLGEARAANAEVIAAVATSAARDAANGAELLDALEHAGVRPEIISGDREAALSFAGATYDFAGEGVLVNDIGGGSTELVFGDVSESDGVRTPRVAIARSIDVGSRRVTELHLRSDPPTRGELDAATAHVAAELEAFFGALKRRPEMMISVAGTATSLAAIDLALEPYDPSRVHGYRLDGSVLAEPARAGVIVGGAIILTTVLALAGLDSTLVSEQDILYGIALDAAAQRGVK